MDRQFRPVFFLVSIFLQGCCGQECQFDRTLELHIGDTNSVADGEGGGQDVIVTNMPFADGYKSRCVQGVSGSYSHRYTSTKYDLDFDTPNDVDDLLYAPMNGTAYVHDDGSRGFGKHVNLDLHDGTYLLMAHMKNIFIENATDVTAGQLLGFEGTTGASTGDHAHFGRHSGDAKKAADYGASLSGLKIKMIDQSTGNEVEVMTSDAVCDLSTGHVYESQLPVAQWHPVGSFLKQPNDSLIFERIKGNGMLAYMNETAFLSRDYKFEDVALISEEELACYSRAIPVSTTGYVRALQDSHDDAWLMVGQPTDSERKRWRLDETGVSGILQSYGMHVSTYDEIDHGADADINSYPNAGRATFRDGSLLSVTGKSDVYVMNAGVAMPILDWDTYLLMGFGTRDIIQVTSDELMTNITSKGNCGTDTYCITKEDVQQCAHVEEVEHVDEDLADSGADGQGNEDSGDVQDSAVAGETFTLRWQTPDHGTADWLTVAGTWTLSSGEVIGWNPVLAEAHGTNSVSYFKDNVTAGDKFRFSMAYGRGSVSDWSCLAPFPPGIVQGTLDAKVSETPVFARAVADPNSAGCQLEIVIP